MPKRSQQERRAARKARAEAQRLHAVEKSKFESLSEPDSFEVKPGMVRSMSWPLVKSDFKDAFATQAFLEPEGLDIEVCGAQGHIRLST